MSFSMIIKLFAGFSSFFSCSPHPFARVHPPVFFPNNQHRDYL